MEGKIDIRTLTQKVIAKWYYFVFAMLLAMPLAYFYIKFTDRVYLLRGSMLLNSEVKNQSEEFLKGMELLTPQTDIEDEIGIIKSHNLVGSAVRKLDFGVSYYEKRNFKTFERYGTFPFTVLLDSTVNQMVGVPIYIERTSDQTYSIHASGKNVGTYNFHTDRSGETLPAVDLDAISIADKPFEHENLKFTIKFNSQFKASRGEGLLFFVIHDLTSVTEFYQEILEVKPITRESNLVEISLRGTVPQKEILFLNTLMEMYLINELQKRKQLGLKTMEFIDEQLSGVSDELQEVESSLESFRLRNNILNMESTAENLTKKLERLEIEKSELESKLKYYKSIARSLNQGNLKSIEVPSSFGLEDPVLNDLILELSKLSQERIELNYSTKEGNPVADVLDLKIANHRKTIIENVTNFIDASSVALTDLNRQISQIKGNVEGLPKSERELVNIQRRFDFNDNVYNYLLEKRAEAGIAIASNSVEKTIIDRAKQIGNGPVAPNKKLILLIAFVTGFTLAVGMIILKDLVDDNIITLQDVEESTKIPFIGTIGHGNRHDRASAIVAHTRSEIGESFRTLRVNLQYLTLAGDDNVIGVTSSIMNEGKTFCSINLAAAIALSGRKTVLLDADLRRPRIASSFMLKNQNGLTDFLLGKCAAWEIINKTPIEGLHVIASGPIPPYPLDLIGNSKMEELIQHLKQHYNTTVIDSPPIGYVSEYVILMKYTSANLYVVRSNYTSRNHLEKINRLYKEKKIKNVSILLNDAKASTNGYRYAYY